MADTKITALAAIATVDPAADVLPIVDISDTSMAASGTTKKITTNQLLGAGGTATLASATITGDLTVDTSTLKVDSTNNRVGIGTATPGAELEVYKSTNGLNRVFINNPSTGVSAYSSIDLTTGTTGGKILQLGSGYSGSYPYITGSTVIQNDSVGGVTLHSVGPYPIYFGTNNTQRMQIDSSGNVGVGVTPSTYTAGFRALEINAKGNSLLSYSNDNLFLNENAYYNGAWKYCNTAASGQYAIFQGSHRWYIAPSGTIDTNITFTQAMTLDASGNLLVGTTSSSETSSVGHKINSSATAPWLATVGSVSTNANVTSSVYSTGAAAYRFYVGYGGTVYATNTVISAISDARYKENVQDIDVGLAAILSLKPRKFDWKAGKGKDIKGDRGFIAQEFETVFPNLVDEWKDPAPEGEAPYKSVRQDLIPVLVKAIQELTARVQTLEAR